MNAETVFDAKPEIRTEEVGRKTTAKIPGRAITAAAALLQAGCLGFIFLNSFRVWIGLAAITAASGSIFHSDPVRYSLAGISLIGAGLTLGAMINTSYLRNRGAARWRKRTLTREERLGNLFSVAVSLGAILLVLIELFMHHKLHPQ